MHLFALLAASAGLIAGADCFPMIDQFGLAARHPGLANLANLNLQQLAAGKKTASANKDATSTSDVAKRKATTTGTAMAAANTDNATSTSAVANSIASTTSAAVAAASTDKPAATTDINPDFDLAAATSAEQAAAVSIFYYSKSPAVY